MFAACRLPAVVDLVEVCLVRNSWGFALVKAASFGLKVLVPVVVVMVTVEGVVDCVKDSVGALDVSVLGAGWLSVLVVVESNA